MSLYELGGQYRQLLEMIDTQDGEINDEWLIAQLQEVEDEIEVEIENHAKVILNKNAEIKALKDEAARLSDRAGNMEGHVKTLKNYMRDKMAQLGIDKIKGQILSVTLRKPAKRLWVDVAMVPPDSKYWMPQPPKLDKQRMKKDLTENKDVPNAELVTGERALLIR